MISYNISTPYMRHLLCKIPKKKSTMLQFYLKQYTRKIIVLLFVRRKLDIIATKRIRINNTVVPKTFLETYPGLPQTFKIERFTATVND